MLVSLLGFPGDSDGKESVCNAGFPRFDPWVRKMPWRRERLCTAVLLPGEFHGQRSLEDPSLWSRKESDVTEQLTLLLPVSLLGFPEGDVTRERVATPVILMEKQGMVWRERITNTTEKRQQKAACERGGEGGSA